EQRKADLDSRKLSGIDDFRQVVVGQRVLPVERQHLIDEGGSFDRLPGLALRLNGMLDIDCGKEVSSEYTCHADAQEHVVSQHPVGHRASSLIDVASQLPQRRNSGCE